MSTLIQPKILKGFRDSLPNQEIIRAELIQVLTGVFRNAGFVPIDTPALEYSEILLRKSGGETEKQVFRFTDNGGRDVALRFDLTVPFARFIAEHYSELYFPFKRYHIAKVWRGEKPQAGRYREFMQCDFDIVGSDSACADFEILSVVCTSLRALGAEDFVVHVSHRGIFNRFLEQLCIKHKSEEILHISDKIAKIGEVEAYRQLKGAIGAECAEQVIHYLTGDTADSSFSDGLDRVKNLLGGSCAEIERMREVYSLLCSVGLEQYFMLDLSITRGLDYYTGLVYETFLTGVPQIGSVCSGGRYDNLTGLYMKESLSGIGGSVGLDRLIAALDSMGQLHVTAGFTNVLVFCGKDSVLLNNVRIADYLKKHGIHAELFPEPKKIQQQYAYAEKKGIRWGLFVEPHCDISVTVNQSNSADTAIAANGYTCNAGITDTMCVRLKDLHTRTETTASLQDVYTIIRDVLKENLR